MTSSRRTNDGPAREAEGSTAGAAAGGDHEKGGSALVVEAMADPMVRNSGMVVSPSSSASPPAEMTSYRRTNDAPGLEDEGSTAGASGCRDLDGGHAWNSLHEPGHLVYWVRQCQICHQVDWDDLDIEIRLGVNEVLKEAGNVKSAH